MELKVIEGSRVKAGDVLVVVPEQWLSHEQLVQCADYAEKVGVHVFFLPPGTQVYIKEQDDAPIESNGYQPKRTNAADPTPPGAE